MITGDTGPLYAATDADDKDHGRRVGLMCRTPPPLLMPAPVLTEVGYLLELDAGPTLSFLAVGQQTVLISVANKGGLQLTVPQRVDREVLGMCRDSDEAALKQADVGEAFHLAMHGAQGAPKRSARSVRVCS